MTTENRELTICFGIRAGTVKEQLDQQGYHIDNSDLDRAEKIYDAITILNVNNYLSDTAWQHAKNRFVREVAQSIRKYEAEQVVDE